MKHFLKFKKENEQNCNLMNFRDSTFCEKKVLQFWINVFYEKEKLEETNSISYL